MTVGCTGNLYSQQRAREQYPGKNHGRLDRPEEFDEEDVFYDIDNTGPSKIAANQYSTYFRAFVSAAGVGFEIP